MLHHNGLDGKAVITCCESLIQLRAWILLCIRQVVTKGLGFEILREDSKTSPKVAFYVLRCG